MWLTENIEFIRRKKIRQSKAATECMSTFTCCWTQYIFWLHRPQITRQNVSTIKKRKEKKRQPYEWWTQSKNLWNEIKSQSQYSMLYNVYTIYEKEDTEMNVDLSCAILCMIKYARAITIEPSNYWDPWMGSFNVKVKRESERANMMPSVLFDDILFKFLYFVLAFCNSFSGFLLYCPRRRASESKQKNDISINNWTFRYAFFGFLCFKNAKTQQEIFSVCVYAFYTFQVANRERAHFARLARRAHKSIQFAFRCATKFCS